MPLFLEIAALLTVADYGHFCLAAFLDELRRNRGALYVRRSYRGFLAVVGQKHLVEGYFVARLVPIEFFNIQNAVLRDNVLLPARLYNSDFSHEARSLRHMELKRKRFDILKAEVDDALGQE